MSKSQEEKDREDLLDLCRLNFPALDKDAIDWLAQACILLFTEWKKRQIVGRLSPAQTSKEPAKLTQAERRKKAIEAFMDGHPELYGAQDILKAPNIDQQPAVKQSAEKRIAALRLWCEDTIDLVGLDDFIRDCELDIPA